MYCVLGLIAFALLLSACSRRYAGLTNNSFLKQRLSKNRFEERGMPILKLVEVNERSFLLSDSITNQHKGFVVDYMLHFTSKSQPALVANNDQLSIERSEIKNEGITPVKVNTSAPIKMGLKSRSLTNKNKKARPTTAQKEGANYAIFVFLILIVFCVYMLNRFYWNIALAPGVAELLLILFLFVIVLIFVMIWFNINLIGYF